MSKAFTKEPDPEFELDDEDEEDAAPSGGKNYMTPEGFKRLQDELQNLKHVERPKMTDIVAWAASNGDRSENADYHYGKKKLREMDRRIRYLTKRIDSAEVVEYTKNTSDQVFFGSTVTIEDTETGEITAYQLVGPFESDLQKNKISVTSPIGKALIGKVAGDEVRVKTPGGLRVLQVMDIRIGADG